MLVRTITACVIFLVVGEFCSGQDGTKSQLKSVTFAESFGKQMEPINPGNQYLPESTIFLSMEVPGRPQSGKVACKFFWNKQFITEATIDLSEVNSGVLFSIGEVTRVGFHLEHEQPLPISKHFRAEVYLNGKKQGDHAFHVVPPKGSTQAKIHKAVLALGVDDDYAPIDSTDTFSKSDPVYLVVQGDVGLQSWVQAEWLIDGKVDNEGTASLTFQENRKETNYSFKYLPENGWPQGTHEVILKLNDEIEVKKKFTINSPMPPASVVEMPARKKSMPADTTKTELPVDPKSVDEFILRGEIYYSQGKFLEALADFNQALQLDPKSAIAISNRAWVFYEQGDLTTAISGFDAAIRLNAALFEAHEGRASVLFTQEEYAEAIKSYSAAIANCTDQKQAARYYNDRGVCFFHLDKIKEALADVQRAVERDTEYVDAYYNHGDLLRMAGRLEEAIRVVRDAIKLDKQNVEFYYLLGQIYDDQQEFEAAIDAYSSAIARDDQQSRYFLSRSGSKQQLNLVPSALKDLERAVAMDPENDDLCNEIGVLHFNTGNFEAAAKHFSEAISLNPDNLSYFSNRADASLNLGNHTQAIQDLTKYIQSSEDAFAYEMRGRAYVLDGDTVAARKDFNRAMQLDPETYHHMFVKSLEVANDTAEPLRVLVRYSAIDADGNSGWLPTEGKVFVFEFKPQQKSILFLGDDQIHSSRFRVWAFGLESGKEYLKWKENDFIVVSEAGYLSEAESPLSESFQFTPEDATAPVPTPSTPSMVSEQQTAEVTSLVYFNAATGATGSAVPVSIKVSKNPGRSLKVGVLEEGANSLGSMWRAGAWVATVLAADISGVDPLDTQVLFEGQGRVDGPSAGGVLTVGVLAAMNGHKVRPDSAMTGTINPDGTIGPVGGIPHKLEGAAQAGKKLVVIPAGLQKQLNKNTEKYVDLFEHGKQLGVEVKPAGDIYTAYELLTGQKLARPAAAPLPELTPAMQQRLKAKVAEWLVRHRDFVARYQETPEKYRNETTAELLSQSKTSAANATKLLEQGKVAIAFQDALEATRLAGIATEVDRTVWVDAERGRETAIRYAMTLGGIKQAREKAVDGLLTYNPRTMSSTGVILNAYTTFVEGLAVQTAGESLLTGKLVFAIGETDEERKAAALFLSAAYVQSAALSYVNILDVLEIAGEVGGREMPADAPIVETALFYRRAAEANMQQFEQSVVNEAAKSAGLPFETMKRIMMQRDQGYLMADIVYSQVIPKLQEILPEEQFAYAMLGGSMHTYVMSAKLTAEHYSLGVERDDSGEPVSVQNESSLALMLDFAEDQALRNIQLLQQNDVDPMVSVFFTQAGSEARNRKLADQLSALGIFWQASVQARTLSYLGGFSAPPK